MNLLLTRKPLCEFTPEEYREYVRSIYEAPESKSESTGIAWRINPRGTLIITCRRKPKAITRPEIEQCATELGRSLPEVWNYCKEKHFIIAATAEDVRKLTAEVAALEGVWPEARSADGPEA